jgi:hypothetical protein
MFLAKQKSIMHQKKFWKLLLWDCTLDKDWGQISRGISQSDYDLCKLWWEEGVDAAKEQILADLARVVGTMAQSVTQRRLFITSRATVGIGPPGMRPKDLVWIVGGGKMPLVLRRSEEVFTALDNNLVSHTCYTLVGEC